MEDFDNYFINKYMELKNRESDKSNTVGVIGTYEKFRDIDKKYQKEEGYKRIDSFTFQYKNKTYMLIDCIERLKGRTFKYYL